MKQKILFEACVGSIESALAAEEGGADRIELCKDLHCGGVTPDRDVIKSVMQKIKIPVNVLIRPRAGHFCYSKEESDKMKNDIEFVKSLNVNGVVFGILKNDGTVDEEKNSELVELAAPLSSTFHRAFDMVNNPFAALETLVKLGFERILTSGKEPTVIEGLDLISELVNKAGSRIMVMPGGGVNEENIGTVIEKTFVKEIHSSARIDLDGFAKTSAEKIKKMKQILDGFAA
ncbi:MAG: copper homeostasis protein CutC [Ignavibacteriales bacterium]|nr:copper homeostasis protein CutC [Ignavibacteriales bacterium]